MFRFTEDCIIGVEQIDEEHQYLFTLLNEIEQVVHDKGSVEQKQTDLGAYIDRLIKYGEIHFAHEEAYMEKIHDPELFRQKRDHAMFMGKVQAIDLIDLNNEEKRKILEDTLIYLIKWLYQHILGSDTLIGKVQRVWDEVRRGEDFCKFTEDFLTGISDIDEEHQILFDIIAQAYRLMERKFMHEKLDGIMGILEQLDDYMTIHFAHEEAYMEKVGYPYLEAQKAAHKSFQERMGMQGPGEDAAGQQAYLEELLDYLFAWLGNHILIMDKKIGEFCREKKL